MRRPQSAAGKGLLLAGSILVLLIALYMILSVDRRTGWTTHVTAIFFAWGLLYIYATYRHFRSVYLFTTAYIISLSVFHFGYIVADAVGWQEFRFFENGGMAYWFELAGWYSILALGSLGVGTALSFATVPTKRDRREASEDSARMRLSLNAAFRIGAVLLLASVVALIFLAGSVGNILRFSRAEIFAGVGDTRGFGFFLSVAPSATVLMVTAAHTARQKWIAYPLAVIAFVGLLFLGYRSNALFPALIGAIIWRKLGRKIPLHIVGSSLVFVILAIPAVSYLRSTGPYQEISLQDIARSVEQSDPAAVVMQLGGVTAPLAFTLKRIPREESFRYGQSYFLALADAIPNLGFQIAESGRAKVRRGGVLDKDALSRLSPSDWYTYQVSRWLFDRGGGAGYSTIAEAYLNFGLPGVVIFFSSLGFVLGRLDQANLRISSNALILTGAFLWPLMKTVRNTFGVFVKPAGFIILTILLWRLATFWIQRAKD